ncbi:hypothetical protein RclHR1_01270015 [Rhizophagus clarus]|uniref:Zn(2)-C6 fungal-type domain-containing protein n=1 Tax=Rhizophagus clarus TaxID=94130 RepID=A0A2Z6QKE9_9GLOM|nr:hypothetical protein RclHR1_01270015 [Rhizophagus clarus]GET02408.1 hypothetical protein GLOIN_2v1477242 [Rhizophagus clarus]
MSSKNSKTTFATSHDQTTPTLKSQKKPRGKINIVACDRCKRDKKKCDGNYLTRKTCKYCHNHNETCVYSEPNLLRITRILNAARKNAAAGEEKEDNQEKSIQELEEQITKYENTLMSLYSQIENKNQIKPIDSIGNLYLSLFSNPQISREQTFILKKLCEITNNVNSNINSEIINKIQNELLILTSNESTEFEKVQSWEELEIFINNENLTDHMIPLAATNFFGFSGSTTPIPSPQFLNNDRFDESYVPINHISTSKKRKVESYTSGGHITIRPTVWNQDDPSEEVPMITVHAPQNNHSINNETVQNPNILFENIPSNENLQFSTLLTSQEPYGFEEVGLDEIEQLSNITSPTFSSNSFSDDNIEFSTSSNSFSDDNLSYISSLPLIYFNNSVNFNENF